MLALPCTPAELLEQVVVPALALLPSDMDSPEARVQLIAESAQETSLSTRQQGGGPAHGLWQGEEGGSFTDVLAHPLVGPMARMLCLKRGVSPIAEAVYTAVLSDDVLACGFARLDLFADPRSLPALGDPEAAWDCYLRVERPGKPRLWDWDNNYQAALAAVGGNC